MLASPRWQEISLERANRNSSSSSQYWIALDVLTIVVSGALATFYKFRTTPIAGGRGFWHGTMIPFCWGMPWH